MKDLLKHGKTGEQREHNKLYDLFESTEMKIAGKRRMEPEWSSQTGAARMEQGRS